MDLLTAMCTVRAMAEHPHYSPRQQIASDVVLGALFEQLSRADKEKFAAWVERRKAAA